MWMCKYSALNKSQKQTKKTSKIPNYKSQKWADVSAGDFPVHELHGQLILITAGANFPLQDFCFQT